MKKVALIHDLSGLGKCSLTAAIPVISVMGMQACPLPTAVLSSQTGFSDYFIDDYTDKMNCFTSQWEKLGMHFDGISSGFLASDLQIEKVMHFLDVFQKEDTFYLADPVLGDNGHVYKMFNEKLLFGMQKLVYRSNICTPNLTELCLLTGYSFDKLSLIQDKNDFIDFIHGIALQLISKGTHPDQIVLVTGIIFRHDSDAKIGNLAVTKDSVFYQESAYTGQSFSGTGDLYASVICGGLMRGMTISEAMILASNFLQPAIEEASAEDVDRNHGVNFEKYLSMLAE